MGKIAIITGRERRRRWSEAEKLRLVAETFEPGAVVAHVARRHDVAESCLYAWRKQFRDHGLAAGEAGSPEPLLIPVSFEEPPLEHGRASEAIATSAPAPPRGRAVVTLPDGTRLEIDADYPGAALRVLLAALLGRR